MKHEDMLEICINCIAYAYGQVKTSEIDVLGLKNEGLENWKRETEYRLIDAYRRLNSQCDFGTYWSIQRKEILEHEAY